MRQAIAVLIAVAVLPPTESVAMELKVVGNQLILSGRVVGDEPGKVREALSNSPEIDTVILRNSPGGDAPAGYQTGQLLRERGLRPLPCPVIAIRRARGCFSAAALVILPMIIRPSTLTSVSTDIITLTGI